MKVTPTVPTQLHRIVRVKKLSQKQQYQRRREEFMKRVHQELGWNYVPPAKK